MFQNGFRSSTTTSHDARKNAADLQSIDELLQTVNK